MFYEILRWVGVITGYPFKWTVFRSKNYYENENATRWVKGGALIISNHFGPLDYVMNVFLFFPRKLYVVASEDAFRTPGLRFGMKFWGGIEANRVTRSMSFVTKSIRELKKDHLVQIFPEGHNTDDGTIKAFYPSYLVIAQKADVPIVPVITDGNYGAFKQAHLMIGEPIYLSDYLENKKMSREDIDRLNEIVRNKVLALREELDRRIRKEREVS